MAYRMGTFIRPPGLLASRNYKPHLLGISRLEKTGDGYWRDLHIEPTFNHACNYLLLHVLKSRCPHFCPRFWEKRGDAGRSSVG
jgi:hypothetical protein